MLTSFRLFGFCLISFFLTCGSWAATYDLNACFKAALNQSETMADQTEQLIQAEEHYTQAIGNVYPYIYGYAAYLRQQDAPTSSSNQPEQHQAKLAIAQPLFRGLREYAAIRQAGDLIILQKEARNWAAIQLYSDVAEVFYSVLALQKDIQHLDIQVELYQKRIQDLKERVAIGRSRSSEVLTVQAALANLRSQRQQILNQKQVTCETLAFLTGLNSDIELEDHSSLPDQTETLELSLSRVEIRPDVLAARKKLEVARANIDIVRGGHWPSVDVSGNYYLDRSGSLSNVTWDAQISLTLPIFTGFITSSKISEAESQFKQSELALRRIQRLAQQDVRNAYQTLKSKLMQVTILQEAAIISEKNYQAVLRDYNYGMVTNLDVLQAMSNYQENIRALDRLKMAVLADVQRLNVVSAKFSPLHEGK